MHKIKLVIAGNKRQFDQWYWFLRNTVGYEDCRFISDINKLRGFTKEHAEIVLVGEYWLNPAFNHKDFVYITERLVIIKPNEENN